MFKEMILEFTKYINLLVMLFNNRLFYNVIC